MGRQVRMSAAQALAAGLLDPAVAELIKSGKVCKAGSAKVSPSSKGADPAPPKRKRSLSRPAVHPKISAGPAGHGSYELDAEDLISAADFVFDLIPVPKERPRVVTLPGTDKTFGYTPARTKYFTSEVRRVVADVFRGRSPVAGPVRLDMTFVMQVPVSWPKWKHAAALDGLIVPTGRPDMDNLEKALLDAFNETLIVDDAYVIERAARKIYGPSAQIRARVARTTQLGVNATKGSLEALRLALSRSLSDNPATMPSEADFDTGEK